MRTYIVTTTDKANIFVATLANNSNEAFSKVKSSYPTAKKTGVRLSAVHLDFVTTCTKLV